jgi:UDP-N-acetylglucosamine:LPS N-acetylglucosamine transferase
LKGWIWFAAADIIISRAASSVSELSIVGKPVILFRRQM